MKTTRVRFAPSPTGWLHVGGARTALFNWLFAKNQEGKFILRIEDTDLKRSQEQYVDQIQEDMTWLDLRWDEFYRQSSRLEIYKRYARKLVQEGKAYHCFCTDEELKRRRERAIEKGIPPVYDGRCRDLTESEQQELRDEGREPVVRFQLPEQQPSVTVPDLIKGEVEFDRVMTGDFVILKSDGSPSYNFACALDDHLMEISHVLRAEDHLSNTPKQMMLYDALGFEKPEFGHFSMLLDEDRSKLSKRSGATSVREFNQEGYLPEALINYLVQLGWSSKDERDIFSREELIDEFSLGNVVDSPQVFDQDRLDWLNNHYLKEAELDRLVELALPYCQEKELIPQEPSEKELARFRRILDLLRPSLNKLAELPDHEDLEIFYGTLEYDAEAREVLESENSPQVLGAIKGKLENGSSITPEEVTEIVRQVKEEQDVGFKEIYKPLRAAVTGKTSGPEIKEVIAILGPSETVQRIGSTL
ncbi:MAG: glutamate--tRNA ligase [Candidatus Bipolaricaulota bacterium]